MARWFDPTDEAVAAWKEWVGGRPENVRAVAERFNPWTLYRLKPTGQRVTIASFGEEKGGKVTLKVNITGEYNLIAFDRQVFGIAPDSLEECDLPPPDEIVGTILTEDDDIEAAIAMQRELMGLTPATGE